jgi:hypothetical protein
LKLLCKSAFRENVLGQELVTLCQMGGRHNTQRHDIQHKGKKVPL